jgi:Derlin-2/3
MIARYGVQLEKGAFEKRTADFLWMMIFGAISLLALSAIPFLDIYFLGVPMVSMLLYVWSREYPNSQISMYGLVQLRSFYLPWAMLGLDVIFGSEILPGLLGILVGHTYYFLSVLHPLATGKNYLKTPMWVYPFLYGFMAKAFQSMFNSYYYYIFDGTRSMVP